MTPGALEVNPNVIATTLEGGDTVLLDLDTRQYFSLNETGTRIWELISNGQGVQDVAAALTREFQVTEEEALEHIGSLISELRKDGLIKSA